MSSPEYNYPQSNLTRSITTKFLLLILFNAAFIGCSNEHDSNTTTDIPNENFESSLPLINDDKLTKPHIETYITIRKSINEMVLKKAVIKTPENTLLLSRFQDIEIHAIKMADIHESQYENIKNLVIKAQTQIKLKDYVNLNKNIITLLEKTLQRHDKTRDRVKSKSELELLDKHVVEIREHIDSLKKSMERYTQNSPSTLYNMEQVEPYVAELNALASPSQRDEKSP